MRGKDIHQKHWDKKGRITPAYAGKRAALRAVSKVSEDHPRLCGEKWVSGFSLTSVYRITPAYAGKRARVAYCVVPKGDHPRLCGEKVSMLTV